MAEYATDADGDNEGVEETADEQILREAREAFECAAEQQEDNRERGRKDVEFARKGCQWPEEIKKQRDLDGRPSLTFPKLQTYIRQVVNDARQNKPAILVQPVDSGADPETAEIFSGLIRNIEVSSDAEVAYDSALDDAVSSGFGYFRINTQPTSDDTFEQDIVIERIADQFSVYGDPYSETADSADWNDAFVVSSMPKKEFRRKYKRAKEVDFDALGYGRLSAPWVDGDQIMVAEYWKRVLVEKQIVALSNGTVVELSLLEAHPEDFVGLTVQGEPRTIRSHKVTQYIITGAEVLETTPWLGKYIPIVPVYGDEVFTEGKRELYSLIHFAIDAQQDYNYWRTATTEMIALAPKAPYIGEEGAFDADPNWSTANKESHPYLEVAAGKPMPQRQPFAGPPAAAIQQSMQANDDMKSAIGLYDASLGARSNETSGVAITARQRQGDVSTFHFIDNLTRAIRHCGRILIDLIPKVYSTPRVLRILGEDKKPQTVKVSPEAADENAAAQVQAHQMAQQQAAAAPVEQQQAAYQAALQEQMAKISRIYDITAGKYDLTVKTGPSFTTQREAAREEIVQIIRAVPQSAAVLGPMYLRNSDWPGAEEAADKIEGGDDQGDTGPQRQLAAMQAQLQQTAAENAALKADQANKAQENQIKAFEAQTKRHEAETDRIRALSEPKPLAFPSPVIPQPAPNPFNGSA